ncbi:MAG TPA: hypothetical protein VGS19_29295 [Streptosporangiaceae bacterium]|nr:hypothetical protein [Streptosporangiaceae bacterium]
MTVHTNPAVGRPSDVNLPVWVWMTYQGPMAPQDRAAVQLLGGGSLWASVQTARPTITLSVSDPGQATVYRNCSPTGSPYSGNPAAIPPCGVTFLAPSIVGPYTITVTATWRVTYSDAAARNVQFGPGWPPAVRTVSQPVTVREIQTVNNG